MEPPSSVSILEVPPATLVVEGEPRPWRRPENRSGGGRRTDPVMAAAQTEIILRWRSARHRKLEGPVRLRLDFYLSGRADNVPDLDNLAKLVIDALANEAFGDDRRVVELELRKCGPSAEPRTEIAVWPAERGP